jgi:hypothetical protein
MSIASTSPPRRIPALKLLAQSLARGSVLHSFAPPFHIAALARFPLERDRSSDEKSRQVKMLERILIAKVSQLSRNSL